MCREEIMRIFCSHFARWYKIGYLFFSLNIIKKPRDLFYITLAFWEKRWHHWFILKFTDPWFAGGKARQSHQSATTPSIPTLTSQLLEKLRKKSWEREKSGNLSTRPSFYVKCDIFCGSAEPLYGFPWVCCRKKLAINAHVWQKTFQLTKTFKFIIK